jgi:hypothetical protein
LLAAQLADLKDIEVAPEEYTIDPEGWLDKYAEKIVEEVSPPFPEEAIKQAIAAAENSQYAPDEADLQQLICHCGRGECTSAASTRFDAI